MDSKIEFEAEIKKVHMDKEVSLDKVFKLFLVTDDERILELAKLPSDLTVKVTVEINDK